jgi:hypothetical protein
MSVVLNTYNFYLSTRERDSGSSVNNATWTLTEPLSLNGEIPSQFQVVIKHATIPFSFLQWNDYTNTAYWEATRGSSSYTGTYTIDKSNYTALNFKTEVIDKLSSSLSAVIPAYTPSITGTYNQYTNRYTFSLANDGTPTSIYFGRQADYSYIDRGLGFIDEWTLTSGSSTTSDSMVNVNPSRSLFLWSNNLLTRNYEAITTSMQPSTNLCTIPIYTLPGSYIIYDSPNPVVNDLKNVTISAINLQIKSENIPYNLQSFTLDYSVVVTITEVTTNFILESHRQQLDKERAAAEAALQQQLVLSQQKDELSSDIQKMKEKEEKRLSRMIVRENAKLLKQQAREEKQRINAYKQAIPDTDKPAE